MRLPEEKGAKSEVTLEKWLKTMLVTSFTSQKSFPVEIFLIMR